MSRRTTTRYLIGAIAGLAIVGVSTAGALSLADVGTDGGTAVVAVTTDVGTSAVTVSRSGTGVVVATSVEEVGTAGRDATTGGASSADLAADTTATAASQSGTDAAGEYADGTYTAIGSYSTPDGSETVTVTVTLVDDLITTVSTTGSASTGTSSQFQSQFLSSYSSQVVGKSIDELSLSRVAGSSLTSEGFNAAIEEIRTDAQA